MTDLKDMTTDQALAHYGVLGMKWGKTRARANASDIQGARSRVQEERQKVKRAEQKAAFTKDPAKRAAAKDAAGQVRASYLKNPDRVIAARMTRGEKIAAAVLLNGVGGIELIAATSARSRRIERKQETGAYDRNR